MKSTPNFELPLAILFQTLSKLISSHLKLRELEKGTNFKSYVLVQKKKKNPKPVKKRTSFSFESNLFSFRLFKRKSISKF